MLVYLKHTDGYHLEAELEIDGHRLLVMDDVSDPERPSPPGELVNPEFDCLLLEDVAWESMFGGNPNKKLSLESCGSWSYQGYGRIVTIQPVVVDFGLLSLDVGDWTNDSRCVGEYLALPINRITVWADGVLLKSR